MSVLEIADRGPRLRCNGGEWDDLHDVTYGASPSVPTSLRSNGLEPFGVTWTRTKADLSSLRANLRIRVCAMGGGEADQC